MSKLSDRMRYVTARIVLPGGSVSLSADVVGQWIGDVRDLELALERMTRANEANIRTLKAKRAVKTSRSVS